MGANHNKTKWTKHSPLILAPLPTRALQAPQVVQVVQVELRQAETRRPRYGTYAFNEEALLEEVPLDRSLAGLKSGGDHLVMPTLMKPKSSRQVIGA